MKYLNDSAKYLFYAVYSLTLLVVGSFVGLWLMIEIVTVYFRLNS